MSDRKATQIQLADAIGVHPITLHHYLHKHRRREDMGEKLANFLMNEGYLFSLPESAQTHEQLSPDTSPEGIDNEA